MSPAQWAQFIQNALARRYPAPEAMLEHRNPWELLVATILSAQCTDERVNAVTPALFSRWPGPEELARADLEELENIIRPTGFFHNKAKNLIACARAITEKHQGQTPDNMEELIKLPGVARKTANVVLFGGFGINMGIAVDTHVRRIAYRTGMTKSRDPAVVERDLMPLFPRDEWGNVNLRLVAFGREVCKARKPGCAMCELSALCPKLEPEKIVEPI